MRLSGTLVLAGLALTACVSTPEQPEVERLVWPPPPLTTRIEFVRSISSEKDINTDTTFSEKVVNFLAGVTPPPTRIWEPMGIAVSDDGGRIYVANFRGSVFSFDFTKQEFFKIADLGRPVGLDLDTAGNLYIVEQLNKQISVYDPQGNKLRSFTDPRIERPTGIAIDHNLGRIYLADTGRSALRSETKQGHNVKVFNMDGELIGQIGKGRGQGEGEFLFPTYVSVDAEGSIYVTDTLNSRVQVFDPAGNYLRKYGERGNAWGMFDKPKGVAVDSFGNVYVADSGWSNVQIFNKQGEVLLFFGGRGPIPGMMKNPTAMDIDAHDRIYVADFINHRINIYRLVNTSAEDSFGIPEDVPEGERRFKKTEG
jgi:DNA-binding beta-propeller fold protein YncE